MKNRKRKKSGRVIAVLLFLILAAAIVLAAVWFGVLKDVILPPSTEQASVDTSEAVPAEPAATPEQVTEPTPEPTPEPTAEPTPEPVKTLSYSSSYTPLGTGMISSGEYEGVSFRENTRVTDAGGKELSVSEDGKSVGTISLDGYVTGLVKLSDGRVGALSWIDNAQKLFILNAASDAVEETVDLPSSAVCFADGCGPYSYYYSDGVNFYGVDLATKSEKVLFNWTAVDVSGTRVSAVNTEDGKVFRCLVNAWRDDLLSYEASFVTITGSENAPAEKKELVLLSGSPMDTLQDAIVSFNRSHDDTRIVLRTLDQASETNPLAALRKIAREEGKMPDLIDLTGMPYQTLASSGLLEDLTPYLEQDGELTLNALVPQVFSALQVNSKIYGTASGFSLTTVLGPSRVLKGMDGWTFQQYNNIASTLGDGNYAFGSADTQASLLYDVLGMNLNRFVNWNDLTCHFDNTDFSRILEFIKRLPAEPRGTNDAEQIQSKVQLLYRAALYKPQDAVNAAAIVPDPVIIGLPVLDGSGNTLTLHRDFAMTVDCADKDAAWQFIREKLTMAGQASSWLFPTNESAFEAVLSAAGEQAELTRTILSHSAPIVEDSEIYNLVLDTAADYFAGNGNSETAAQKVQAAVSAYLESLKV